MRIIINSINYFPELTGIGKYSGEMAEWLAQQGHEVTVITAPPYYPAWKVSQGYSSYKYKYESLNGVSIYRCPLWVPGSPSGLKRIIHLASFAITSLPVLLWKSIRKRPDIIFVLEPTFFCVPGAWISARLSGAKAWLHIQDFEVDAAFDLGILNNQRVRRIVLGIERWIMQRMDTVSTISEKMLEKLANKGIEQERCVLFPNWVDTQRITPLEDTSSIRIEFGINDDAIVLLYSGNMGEKQGLELLIETAKILIDNKQVVFVLCGDGSARKRLESDANGLNNIKFFPLQPIERLNELLSMADIHLLPQRADAEDLVMPSKLTNMMASARPVVATAKNKTQVANVVLECGIVVEPGNVDKFVHAIQSLVANPTQRIQLGKKGREHVVKHWTQGQVLSRVFPS